MTWNLVPMGVLVVALSPPQRGAVRLQSPNFLSPLGMIRRLAWPGLAWPGLASSEQP